MNYKEIVEYILDIPKFTKKNTMEDSRRFFEFLGCPGEGKKVIHVAGTNGKGSVCAFLNQVIIASGHSVGMFTSPHLIHMEERFQINGKQISKQDFVDLAICLKKYITKYQEQNAEYHPTFFEFLFFLGMLYFERENVKIIILETGLGGRLDATNIILQPMVCAITKIALDHTEYLGTTLNEVAYEKAGIIKAEVPVVFWDDESDIRDVILNQAKMKNARAKGVSLSDIDRIEIKNKKIDFYYNSSYYKYMHLEINSVAEYQIYNALIVIKICEVIRDQIEISLENIQTGMKTFFWPGRMEEIETGIFLEGAHNLDGIKAFLQGSSFKSEEKSILLFSVVKEKNYENMIEEIIESEKFSLICVTNIEGSRGLEASFIADEFRKYKKNRAVQIVVKDKVEEAFQYRTEKRKISQQMYVVGSLYLIGEIKRIYEDML